MPGTADLLVVGAGPAGAAAAITARGHGLEVALVDKAAFPRDKTCGDGLTTAALGRLERLGVSVPGLGVEPVRSVVVVAPDHWQVELPLPAGGWHATVVERSVLDAAVLDRARAVGVSVHDGVGVEAVAVDGDTVRVRTSDETEWQVPFVVAADGHYSTVRRLTAPAVEPDLGAWHAVRQYFAHVGDPRLWVLFERDLLPGYAWVFPLPDGRANVGFGVLRRAGHDGKALKRLWGDLLARPVLRAVLGARAEPESRYRAWPIPTAYSAARLVDGRVLYAGDAAAVVDPMTGEGIAQALDTGVFAADAIAADVDPSRVGAHYRDTVDRALGRDLRFAAFLQRLLQSGIVANGAIRAAGLSPWTRRNFARWMFEDYPRAALFTPDRWRRDLFTPKGAFT
ncbi:MAG TPA: geranylgeranyl reductase family protein [Acidimicrobiia bacterium]|nr:geranylgeranyl reductase family protein [Acidimicrobiia bacterium]